MRLQHVHVTHDFSAPVERVFAYLSEHENLGPLFGVRIVRVCDGETDRNGVGSCRRLSFQGLLPFDETVTGIVPNERITYRITKGSPMRGHEGNMVFSTMPSGGTHLDYRIRFGSAVPGLALIVKTVLTGSIARGLTKLDRQM
jgi:uncharacterized protein YndB with AHSA1/START domain